MSTDRRQGTPGQSRRRTPRDWMVANLREQGDTHQGVREALTNDPPELGRALELLAKAEKIRGDIALDLAQIHAGGRQ